MPKLTYSAGGREHSVDVTDSCSIGRDDTNTVVLDASSGASRRHCQIIKLGKDVFELADLGSTNGTVVNDASVKRHKLRDGDRIRVGEAVLMWRDPNTAQEDDGLLEEEISLDEPAPRRKASASSGDRCYLVFAGGAKDGQKIPLDKDRITFGRKSSNTVVIDDNGVSGYHCEVSREGGAYMLRDLGSTNGTLLDGELITEVALTHGGRLRIGAQRFVFVDPSVEGFEKAMSAVEDLGSEWGLLRAEMDMDRVQKARRSQAVAVIGVVAVVAVLCWFFLQNPEMFREPVAKITPIEKNLVADFSFEGGGEKWGPAPNSPSTLRVERGEGKQGERFLVVSRDGPNGSPAAARQTGESVAVRPGKPYEFGASLRAANGGQAAVRVIWEGSSEDGIVSMDATPLTAGSSWTDVTATATAPADARGARLELINAGPGSASFDDVVFRESAGADRAVTSTRGSLTLRAAADGAVTLRRDNDVLLAQIGVAGGVFAEDDDRGGRRGDRIGSVSAISVSAVENGVEVTGKVFDPGSGTFGDFGVTYTIPADNVVEINGSLPKDAALVGGLPKKFVEESVGVFTSSGRSFRMTETRIAPSVSSVSIGDLKRFRLRGPAGSGDFEVALFADDGSYELALAATTDQLGIRIETDSAFLRDELRRLSDSARDAETQKRHGKAIKLYRELLGQVTQGSPESEAAEKAANRLEQAGRAEIDVLRDSITEALEFQNTDDLSRAIDKAADLVTSYQGHEVENLAQEQLVRAREAQSSLLAAEREQAAAPLLRRAMDLVASNDLALARALLNDVVIRFDGTAAAKTATAQLDALAGN